METHAHAHAHAHVYVCCPTARAGPTAHTAELLVHTPEIVAPETLGSLRMPLARESSPVDMWSSGALLYTLLCGAPPFGYVEMDGVDVLFARVSTAYHDQCLSAAWVGVSEDAKELVNGLLHRDPLKRPTAAEVLQHPWVAAALA